MSGGSNANTARFELMENLTRKSADVKKRLGDLNKLPAPPNSNKKAELEKELQGVKDTAARLDKVSVRCRNFYIAAIQQIKTQFCFDDPLFTFIDLLVPSSARDFEKHPSLAAVLLRFPILREDVNPQKLDDEWRAHKTIHYSKFSAHKKPTNEDDYEDCVNDDEYRKKRRKIIKHLPVTSL